MDLFEREASFGVDIIRQGSFQHRYLVRWAQRAHGAEQFNIFSDAVPARDRYRLPDGQSLTQVECRSNRIRVVSCGIDRKSTRLNSSHVAISYAVFCLKKKKVKGNETECYG